MNIIISGRKVEVGEDTKQRIEKKMKRLSKFFNDDTQVFITITAQREQRVVEVTIYSNGMIYRAEETNYDILTAVDKILDIIERQIRKNKTRLEKKIRAGAFLKPVGEGGAASEEEIPEDEIKIIKTKKHILKPMLPEEAILQMNLLGHSFFVFLNAETHSNAIVYKRKDGAYGMIETE